jgi:hypothetical protein
MATDQTQPETPPEPQPTELPRASATYGNVEVEFNTAQYDAGYIELTQKGVACRLHPEEGFILCDGGPPNAETPLPPNRFRLERTEPEDPALTNGGKKSFYLKARLREDDGWRYCEGKEAFEFDNKKSNVLLCRGNTNPQVGYWSFEGRVSNIPVPGEDQASNGTEGPVPTDPESTDTEVPPSDQVPTDTEDDAPTDPESTDTEDNVLPCNGRGWTWETKSSYPHKLWGLERPSVGEQENLSDYTKWGWFGVLHPKVEGVGPCEQTLEDGSPNPCYSTTECNEYNKAKKAVDGRRRLWIVTLILGLIGTYMFLSWIRKPSGSSTNT